jgi:DNA-binding transcriptional LysR family regulator
MISLNDAAYRAIAQRPKPARIRLGLTPDLLTVSLLEILNGFRSQPGDFELEIVADVSWRLVEQVDAGMLDGAFVRRLPGQGLGTPVFRQPVVWVGNSDWLPPPSETPLPLVLFPDGCTIRDQILNTLDATSRAWRVAFTSTSLDNVRLAVRMELGITALPLNTVDNIRKQPHQWGLPPIGELETAFILGANCGKTTEQLVERIADHCLAQVAATEMRS